MIRKKYFKFYDNSYLKIALAPKLIRSILKVSLVLKKDAWKIIHDFSLEKPCYHSSPNVQEASIY